MLIAASLMICSINFFSMTNSIWCCIHDKFMVSTIEKTLIIKLDSLLISILMIKIMHFLYEVFWLVIKYGWATNDIGKSGMLTI